MSVYIGVPVAPRKVEGPATSLVFLGILLDTEAYELRLPEEKLMRLKVLIAQWQHKKACTKLELLVRCMIDLSTYVKEMYHYLRLKAAFRSDLQW